MKKIASHEFAEIAAQWGSLISAGDPGACMYGFSLGDGAVQSEGHRAACLKWVAECREGVSVEDAEELAAMSEYLRHAPVAGDGVKIVGYIDITPSREMRAVILANMEAK